MNLDDESADLELLKRYRRVSGAGPSLPTDAVREAILAEGRRVAAKNAQPVPRQFDAKVPAAKRSPWRFTAIGTACAAVLAGFLVLPRFLMRPQERAVMVQSSAPEAIDAAPAPAPMSEAVPAPPPAAAAPAPTPRDRLRRAPSVAHLSEPEKAYTAPALAELQQHAASRNSATSGAELGGGARKSTAGADTASSVVRGLSSDLRQTTIPPVPSIAPGAAQDAEIAGGYKPPEVVNNLPAPKENSRAQAAGGAANDLEEVVVSGMKANPPRTPLLSAVNWGRAAKAAALLESGEGSVMETDSKGRTPLLRAVEHKRLDLVQLLIAHGADPDAPDADGDTPLSIARQKKLADIVGVLEAASEQSPR